MDNSPKKRKNCHKKVTPGVTTRDHRDESPYNLTPEAIPETRRSVSRSQNAIPETRRSVSRSQKRIPRVEPPRGSSQKTRDQRRVTLQADPDYYNGPPLSIGLRLGTSADTRRVCSQMYGYLSLRACPPRTTSLIAKVGRVCNRDQPRWTRLSGIPVPVPRQFAVAVLVGPCTPGPLHGHRRSAHKILTQH